jgi:hypothetical protein
MEKNKRRKKKGKSKAVLVLAGAFLCLFMAGSASATDETTFPVDEAGIAAYVHVNESIDLGEAMTNLMPVINDIIVTNETYFIVTVPNNDKQLTHLYVGADGWVIPYYPRTKPVSYIVRWNVTSSHDPTPQNVTTMTTLEEVISTACDAVDVAYETIESDIKFYDFEHPDANRVLIVVDMHSGSGSDTFYMVIPSEFVTLNESAYSHYMRSTAYRKNSRIIVDGTAISNIYLSSGEFTRYGDYGLALDKKHTITLQNEDSYVRTSGVGWVLVYHQ